MRIVIREDEGYCCHCNKVYKLTEAKWVESRLGYKMAMCPFHGKQLRRNYRCKGKNRERKTAL